MENCDDTSGFYSAYTRKKAYTSLKEYAEGFQHGFDNFIPDKIITPVRLTNKEENTLQAIYDFICNSSNYPALKETFGGGDNNNVFSGWYEDGIMAGYFYCAWYYILSNHRIFEPYFNKALLPSRPDPQIDPIDPLTLSDTELFIKINFLGKLKEVEKKISIHVDQWKKKKGTKIACAAFVELLFEKSYFRPEFQKYPGKHCTAFANSRYGIDISVQMK
jgi:hypothetical protein